MTPSSPPVLPWWRSLASDRADKLELASLAIALLSLAIIGGWTIHPWLSAQNTDGASYYLLGFSLAKAGAYVLPSLPTPQPVFNYPPLWPAMIAAVMKLLGSYQPAVVVPALKGLTLALYAGAIALIYSLYRRRAPAKIALLTALLLVVSGVAHRYWGDLLADIPYLFLSAVFLWDFIKGAGQPGGPFASRSRAIRLLALLALMPMMRPVGLMLGVAASAHESLDRRWKSAALALLATVSLYGGWLLSEHQYRSVQTAGDPALQRFVDASPVKISFLKYFVARDPGDEDASVNAAAPALLLKDSLRRLEQYGRMATETFWPICLDGFRLPGLTRGLLMIFSLALIAFGFWRQPRALRILGLYTGFYLLLLLTYPYVSPRYLLPVLPWVTAAYLTGLTLALGALQRCFPPERRERAALLAAAALMIAATLAITTQLARALPFWSESAVIRAAGVPGVSPRYGALFATLAQIKAAQESGRLGRATLIARKPELAFFYTGVHAKRYPFYSDPNKLFAWLQAERDALSATPGQALYILDDGVFKESRRLLAPALAAHRDQLTPVFSDASGSARLWKLAPLSPPEK